MKKCTIFLFLFFASVSYGQSPDLTYAEPCRPGNDYATFSVVGDILIHDLLYQAVYSGSKNFSQIWRKTDPLIRKADFSMGNLEGPAALGVDKYGKDHGDVGFTYDRVIYSGTHFSFNFHPRILGDLQSSGYDLLTMANNHSLDRGWLGIDKTVLAARQQGLPIVGIRHSEEHNASFHRIVKINNLRVAFIGCTEMLNGHEDGKEQVLLCYRDANKIVQLIRDLMGPSGVDAVIVMPHWGSEYQHVPGSRQKHHARLFLEAGAVAIFGSHPHVLQPWEKYVTKDGRETLIAYSLGNFAAGQAGIEKKTGVVTYLGLTKSSGGRARIFGVAYTPTYREGAELFPVSSKNFAEARSHASLFFGTKTFLEPSLPLVPQLCRKTDTAVSSMH